MSLYLHLNSEYADDITNNTFLFSFPLIEGGQQDTIYLSVEHATIPYSWYNINNNNNTLNYRLNNINYSLTITNGNYNALELRDYLKSNLPFEVTFNKIKNKYTFTHTTSDFSFLSSSTCFKLLGFRKNTTISSFSKILTSTNCINLIYTPCVCIYSNFNNPNINISASKNNKRLLTSISLDKQPNNLLNYMNKDLRVDLDTNNLSLIEITICDIEGQPLDLNGVNWAMTFKLDFVDFVN